jgi:hypothetical protein
MLVSPENTPSVAEGTAVQKAAAAMVQSVWILHASVQFNSVQMDDALPRWTKQIAQQHPQLAMLSAISSLLTNFVAAC